MSCTLLLSKRLEKLLLTVDVNIGNLMDIEHVTTTEEMVLNPEYRGLRTARIEVFVKGKHYPYEVGRIKVWNNDKLFCKVRDLIERNEGGFSNG